MPKKAPKYLPPVKAVIIKLPSDLAKWTKEDLVAKVQWLVEEHNFISTGFAAAQTKVNNLNVDLKSAKAELKAAKAGKDAA